MLGAITMATSASAISDLIDDLDVKVIIGIKAVVVENTLWKDC